MTDSLAAFALSLPPETLRTACGHAREGYRRLSEAVGVETAREAVTLALEDADLTPTNAAAALVLAEFAGPEDEARDEVGRWTDGATAPQKTPQQQARAEARYQAARVRAMEKLTDQAYDEYMEQATELPEAITDEVSYGTWAKYQAAQTKATDRTVPLAVKQTAFREVARSAYEKLQKTGNHQDYTLEDRAGLRAFAQAVQDMAARLPQIDEAFAPPKDLPAKTEKRLREKYGVGDDPLAGAGRLVEPTPEAPPA